MFRVVVSVIAKITSCLAMTNLRGEGHASCLSRVSAGTRRVNSPAAFKNYNMFTIVVA